MTERINWMPVLENSSSVDAVVLFSRGHSLTKCEAQVWDPQAKAVFKQLKKMPVKEARKRARSWVSRNLLRDYLPAHKDHKFQCIS